MSGFHELTGLFRRRLLAAAREDLMGPTTTSGYEEELRRQRSLLAVILTPEIKLRRAEVPADVQQLGSKEELPPEQQEWSPRVDQEDTEPPHIKEEQEDLWSSQEGEQLQGLEEVKEEEEEKPQTGREEENRDLMGGADPERLLQPDGEDMTEDSSDPESEVGHKDGKDSDRKSFGCCVCGKIFQHKGNLNIHMRTHTGEKPYSCLICAKSFGHKGALTYHMNTHTGVKRLSCCVAKRSQPHTSDKVRKPLSCSECDATFPNNYLLVTHMRMHKGKKLFTCTVCGQKRQFRSHLEIHMRTHTGEKPYSCSVCGKRFSQRGIMTQHMAVHSEVRPYGCTDCGRRFFWQFQVKKHKCVGKSFQQRRAVSNDEPNRGSTHMRKSGALLKADADAETSVQTDDSVDIDFWKETRQHQLGFTYRRNKKASVNDGRHPVCSYDMSKTEAVKANTANIDLCKQARQLQSGLNHLKHEGVSVSSPEVQRFSFFSCHRTSADTHRKCDTGDKPFSCLFCGKGFATGGYLTRHISVHTGQEALSCIVCERRFTMKSEMINHVCVESSEHPQITANTPFSCSQCGKGFRYKHNLLLHMGTHTGEKPFSCSVCGQIFARHESLSFHMTCHTVEKPFCCSVCNTGFIDSESLIKHMRIHTGQTQFSCSICGKEFAWRRHLTKHMEVHTPEQIYSCQPHTEQEESGADGEDCEGAEAASNSHHQALLQPETEDKTSPAETEDSDDWMETTERQSGLNSAENKVKRRTREKKSHVCSECGKRFRRKDHLTSHMLVHTGEKPFSCSECGKRFNHKCSLTLHTALHRGEKPFSCSVCDQRFSWCSQLKKHVCVVGVQASEPHRNKPEEGREAVRVQACLLSSETCLQPDTPFKPGDSSGPEAEDKNDAFREIREQQSALNCERKEGISQTAATCDSDRKRVCRSDSDEMFSTSHQKSHKNIHTGEKRLSGSAEEDPQPPLIKQEQEEVWISQPDAMIFTPVYVKSEEDEEKPQSSQLHLRHSEQVETGAGDPQTLVQPVSEDCSLSISLKTDDSADSDFWTEARERPAGLKQEETSDSVSGCDGKTALSCSDDKAFLDPASGDSMDSDFWKEGSRKPQVESNALKDDISADVVSHTRRKPHSCSQCGKSFHQICNLKNHMRFHRGERAFLCSVCGLKCLYKSHLKIHMRTHTGEKPFICPVCGKKYAHKASMQTHMAVHTVDKQHTCSVCKDSFTWYTELKYHQCVGESSQETADWREKTALHTGDQ